MGMWHRPICLMLDICGTVNQHKVANNLYSENPKVSSDITYYITTPDTVTPLCDFCINMALRSEA